MYEQRIQQLLYKLTLQEKIGMIHGAGLFRTEGVQRLGIPPFKMADGPMGVRAEFENAHWIPLNRSDDYVTYLPSGNAIASSWNKKLAYHYGQVLGEEARGRGKDMILAPSINIIRSPLCGRNFEYLSEDPYFITKMAPPMVRGIQEFDVACCVKHFAANNQETNRTKVDTIVDEKTLHEIYLPGFKAVIDDANALGIMGAYNKINGEQCCHSPHLLDDILRNQWGYKHLVVSDWSGVTNTIEAASTSIDIEMSVTDTFDEYYLANPLLQEIENGTVQVDDVDKKVANILRVMFQLKMIGSDTVSRQTGSYNTTQHQQVAYDIATETIVLLKNEGLLPLSKDLQKILIIGDNAERIHSNGGGSAEIKALYEISPLLAMKSKLGGNCEIEYVQGYYISDTQEDLDRHWQEMSLETKQEYRNKHNRDIAEKQRILREEAVRKAQEYDQVIFCGGLSHFYDVEGQDKPDYDLPYGQDQLLQELLDVNPNTIVYILSGSAVNMTRFAAKSKAILWSSYNGMNGGNALVDILFGDVNPSGKLAQTFAKELTDYSSHSIGEFAKKQVVHYTENEMVGYRHFLDKQIRPLFSFGYGLSYTTFTYQNHTIYQNDQNITVTCTIANTGNMDGKEIVQVYLSNEDSTMKLIGFEKVFVAAGSQRDVTIQIPYQDIKEYDVATKQFHTKQGTFSFHIGSSLDNINKVFTIQIASR